MKTGTRLLLVFLAIMLAFSMPIQSYAVTSRMTNSIRFIVDFQEKMSPRQTSCDSQSVKQSGLLTGSVEICGSKQKVQLIVQPEDSEKIVICGQFYVFLSGAYSEDILGGDFQTDSNIEVVFVKVENGQAAYDHYGASNPVLCIKYVDFYGNDRCIYSDLSDIQFASLRENSVSCIEGSTKAEYDEFVTRLCFPFEGDGSHQSETVELIYDGQAESTNEIQEATVSSTSSAEIDSFYGFTYQSIQDFISEIRRLGTTNLYDLGVSPDVFSDPYHIRAGTIYESIGWASAYDVMEYDVYRYVVLNVMDFKVYQSTLTDGEETIQAQLEIKDSIYFQYYPVTGEVIHISDSGLKVSNVNLRISKLRGNATDVFVKLERGGVVHQPQAIVPTLLGLIPKLDVLMAMCSVFSTQTTGAFNAMEYVIGSTYEEQVARYNGKVCRAIALQSNGCHIKYVGDRMGLKGTVKTASAGRYGFMISFSVDGFWG